MTRKVTQANLFPAKFREEQFEVHEHIDLRSRFSPAPRLKHSHMGGSIPHMHNGYGPSFYGYGSLKGTRNKFTSKPTGEQLSYVALSEEESSFELVITDSAQPMAVLDKKTGKYVSRDIHSLSIDEISMPAAERMMAGSRLKCIVRDERKRRA